MQKVKVALYGSLNISILSVLKSYHQSISLFHLAIFYSLIHASIIYRPSKLKRCKEEESLILNHDIFMVCFSFSTFFSLMHRLSKCHPPAGNDISAMKA